MKNLPQCMKLELGVLLTYKMLEGYLRYSLECFPGLGKLVSFSRELLFLHISFGKGSDLAKCRKMPMHPVFHFFMVTSTP